MQSLFFKERLFLQFVADALLHFGLFNTLGFLYIFADGLKDAVHLGG